MSTSPMQQTPSIHIVARLSLPLIALLAFGLRLYQLTDEPMWMDETRQILIATTSTSAAEIIDRAAQQQQPPLDYLLLALSP